jgi:chromosomal replication initiation ATPase DnaA
MFQQLVLPIDRPPSFAAVDFVMDTSNEEALRWLSARERWPMRRLVLAGPPGTGKTHLLHATAQAEGWDILRGADLRCLPPVPERGAVVDDADTPAEEVAFLHLMNACAEAGLPLLMAATRPPSRWGIALPDLRSRLAATAVAMLDEPSDALLEALLAKHLADLQFEIMDPYIVGVIRHRLPRSAAVTAEAVARLSRASLVAGRRLRREDALEAIKPLFDDDSGTSNGDGSNSMPLGPTLL